MKFEELGAFEKSIRLKNGLSIEKMHDLSGVACASIVKAESCKKKFNVRTLTIRMMLEAFGYYFDFGGYKEFSDWAKDYVEKMDVLIVDASKLCGVNLYNYIYEQVNPTMKKIRTLKKSVGFELYLVNDETGERIEIE